jgi:cyanophycinase
MTSNLRTKAGRALLAAVPFLAIQPAVAGSAYTYSSLGAPSAPVSAKPASCFGTACTPSVVLMGGGYDVAEAFRWMIARAGITRATGGRFVIIRATGTDAYNPYVYSRLGQIDTTTPRHYETVGGIDLGVTSVETLVIPTRKAAADPFVLGVIARASAIFIAGGDQADYYNNWQGTALDTALQRAVNAGIPVGGTSAGNAMLGQYAFAALNGSVTSDDALADPFNKYMTIDPLNTASKKFVQTGSFLAIPTLEKTITDDHFNTRDRLGRLFGFVARIGNGCPGGLEAFGAVLGIGIDEETAVLVSGPREREGATGRQPVQRGEHDRALHAAELRLFREDRPRAVAVCRQAALERQQRHPGLPPERPARAAIAVSGRAPVQLQGAGGVQPVGLDAAERADVRRRLVAERPVRLRHGERRDPRHAGPLTWSTRAWPS